ncbi:MAG: DegV family protein [Peptostreptococcaceae bacterium]|nr:DegV family protein [Peptostreptococcaceae bacterium]
MIKLLADSTCDLSLEIIEKYKIGIAPLNIHIEGKSYKDRVDIQPDEFYGMIDEVEGEIRTANPSPQEFLKLIEEGVKDGYDDFLCICMSSGTSGSYQSAEIAREYFGDKYPESKSRVYVVDSVSMSHGSGWLIMKTARLMEKGATFEELIEFNETYKYNMKHFLSVDDLDHLIKSGRLSNASAIIGKMLKIKPIMTMKNKKGAIVAKERGRKNVYRHYTREFNDRVDLEMTDFVIIGYTSDIKIAENFKNILLKETGYDGEIFIMQMGVSVGAHVGLGGLSLYFIEKDRIKDNILRNELQFMKDRKNRMLETLKRYR